MGDWNELVAGKESQPSRPSIVDTRNVPSKLDESMDSGDWNEMGNFGNPFHRMKVQGRTEGGRTEGGRTEGGRTEGGRTEGGRTDGGRTEGGRTEGGRTEGGRRGREN